MLKEELKQWLDIFNNVTVPNLIKNGFKATPINAREGLANLTSGLTTEKPEVAQILDEVVITNDYNVPVRIYNPKPDEELPVLLQFHGGGHMGGSVTVYDPISRKLALATNHIVVSVEYRLAPENPYPTGLNDSYNVVKFIWKTLDDRNIKYKKELSLFGDSAGGAVIAGIVERAQYDKDIKIENQILLYPSLDYTVSKASTVENGTDYLLTRGKILWYFDNYFQNNESRVLASPLFGQMTNKIPRTLVMTAEYCPLRDEGIEYVEKLKKVGVETEFYNFENMIHTFMNMENLCKEECKALYSKINEFLKK